MSETTTTTTTTEAKTTKRAPKRVQVPVTGGPNGVSRLISRSRTKEEAKRNLAGRYRVIHGRIAMARPIEEWQRPDGTEIPHEPKQVFAEMGDIVELTHEDAERMLGPAAGFPDGLDIVEPLDAKPSRVGKVRAPDPVPFRNPNA
jgi:hypothetical protein